MAGLPSPPGRSAGRRGPPPTRTPPPRCEGRPRRQRSECRAGARPSRRACLPGRKRRTIDPEERTLGRSLSRHGRRAIAFALASLVLLGIIASLLRTDVIWQQWMCWRCAREIREYDWEGPPEWKPSPQGADRGARLLPPEGSARASLLSRGPGAYPVLARLLRHPDPVVRSSTAGFLELWLISRRDRDGFIAFLRRSDRTALITHLLPQRHRSWSSLGWRLGSQSFSPSYWSGGDGTLPPSEPLLT